MGVVEELRAEQAHIDRAYARLDELRSSASSLAEDVIGLGRGGSLADRVDRDARVQLALARRAALSVGERPCASGDLTPMEETGCTSAGSGYPTSRASP